MRPKHTSASFGPLGVCDSVRYGRPAFRWYIYSCVPMTSVKNLMCWLKTWSWSAAQNLSIVEFDDEIILEQDVLKRNHHAECRSILPLKLTNISRKTSIVGRWNFEKFSMLFGEKFVPFFAGSKSPLDKDFCCGKFLLFWAHTPSASPAVKKSALLVNAAPFLDGLG